MKRKCNNMALLKVSMFILGLTVLLGGCSSVTPRDSTPIQSAVVQPTEQIVPTQVVSQPVPTAEATQMPSAEIDEKGYFDDSLFVGDSIMEGIRQYVMAQRQEGEMLDSASFLTSTMGISLAGLLGELPENLQFTYQGVERSLEDIVIDIAPRRVFLLLGLNDLASDPEVMVTDCIERYARLVDRLQMSCPETEFIIITNPPKVASAWLPDYTANRNFNNQLIGEYVEGLLKMCLERNIPYIDAYAVLKNENGALPDDFCRDGYIHLNHQGAAVVVEAIEAFARGEES